MSKVQQVSSAVEIEDLIRARYPLIYIVSSEEERVERRLREFALKKERKLAAWSITKGFVSLAGDVRTGDVRDPLKALDNILAAEGRGVYILRDFHAFLENSQVVRKLRDVAHELKKSQKNVILLSPVLKVPPELEKETAVVDFDLPDRAEIDSIVQKLLENLPPGVDPGIAADPVGREALVEAALGLTYVEAENVLSKSIVRNKTFHVPTVLQEKKHIIRKSGILEYYEATEQLDEIGGLDVLKTWLQKRRGAFSQKARDFGLPMPKGILLIGVPGCGKSLTAKAVGSAWQMPLLRLDVGKIFGGLVGQSEENIRKAIRTAEAIAPAVLWLDEMEKGFSGTASSGQTDGGTTSRVFGTFITWLQEKTSSVFVIATANDVRSLPPELLRKGRFDEIFFVDLPTKEERRSIIEIHVRRKQRDPSAWNLDKLADATTEYSGSELEMGVVSALYDAYDAGHDLNEEGVTHSLREIVPLAITMKENIDIMRDWAKTRARPASTPAKSTPDKSGSRFSISTGDRKIEV